MICSKTRDDSFKDFVCLLVKIFHWHVDLLCVYKNMPWLLVVHHTHTKHIDITIS